MRKLLFALAILASALVAAFATSTGNARTTRAASNVAPACDFTGGVRKYSSGIHFEPASPTFTSYGMNQTITYWIFPGNYDHTIEFFGISTFTTAGVLKYWVQAGQWTGYDAWGNQVSNNYPLGNYTDASHPFDGHAGGSRGTAGTGPVYTPTGGFVLMRYVESTDSVKGYHLQFLGKGTLGNGVTTNIVNNGNHVFTMTDQQSNVIGGAGGAGDHISMPALTYDGVNAGYQDFVGQEIYDAGDAHCGYVESNIDHFSSNTASWGSTGFWNHYQGCNQNGLNSDNPADPTCHGGAAGPLAPLDMEWATTGGLLTLYPYCAEGIGHGPPFFRKAGVTPVVGVSSSNAALVPVDKVNVAPRLPVRTLAPVANMDGAAAG